MKNKKNIIMIIVICLLGVGIGYLLFNFGRIVGSNGVVLLAAVSKTTTFFRRQKKSPRTLSVVSSALATNSPPDCSLNASRPQLF